MTDHNARQAGLTDSTVAEVMADCEAFEAAMVDAGYNRPDLGRHPGMYRYQRDQDRFTGWKLARAILAAHSADARNGEGVALTEAEMKSAEYLNNVSQPGFMHCEHLAPINEFVQRLLHEK